MTVTLLPHRGSAVTTALVTAILPVTSDDPRFASQRIGIAIRDADLALLTVDIELDTVVLDADVHAVSDPAESGFAGSVVTVGLDSGADFSAADVATTATGTSFRLVSAAGTRRVDLALLGERHVVPALATIVLAIHLGADIDEAVAAVSGVTGEGTGDLELVPAPDGITLIDDSADASPVATIEALKTVAEIAGESRRSIAVLGPLAMASDDLIDIRDEHDRIGRIVVRLNIGKLIVVGAGARHLASAAGLEGSWDGESVLVATPDEAYSLLRTDIREGDVVLVKISQQAPQSASLQAHQVDLRSVIGGIVA